MTIEIEMTDAEYNSISEFAAENKIGVTEIFLKSALEKIEDAEWFSVSQKLIESNKKSLRGSCKVKRPFKLLVDKIYTPR